MESPGKTLGKSVPDVHLKVTAGKLLTIHRLWVGLLRLFGKGTKR